MNMMMVLNTYHHPPVTDASDSSFGDRGAPENTKIKRIWPALYQCSWIIFDMLQGGHVIYDECADDHLWQSHLLITCLHRPSPDELVGLEWSCMTIVTIGYI